MADDADDADADGGAAMTTRTDAPLPPVVRVAGVVAALFFALPLVGVVLHAPWSRALAEVSSPRVLSALALSVVCALASVVVAVIVGVPLAALLARTRGPWTTALRALVTLPLVLPPVVAGIGLLLALGRRGLLGGALSVVGVELPFTTAGAVVAASFVAMPFLVLSVEAGFARVDPRHVDAARVLGASPSLIARVVVLPALQPSLRAGAALCFARALGEFGATITFAGNLEGRTQTLPLLAFEMLHEDPSSAALVSLLLVLVAVAALVGLRAWPGRAA